MLFCIRFPFLDGRVSGRWVRSTYRLSHWPASLSDLAELLEIRAIEQHPISETERGDLFLAQHLPEQRFRDPQEPRGFGNGEDRPAYDAVRLRKPIDLINLLLLHVASLCGMCLTAPH